MKIQALVTICLVAAALLIAAGSCDDETSETSTNSSTSGEGGEAGHGGSGGGGEGGEGGEGGSGGVESVGYGMIEAGSAHFPPADPSSAVYAIFLKYEDFEFACVEVATYDSCAVQECDWTSSTTLPKQDAGTITISGGPREATVSFDGERYPIESSSTEELFLGGEIITFAAAGSDVIPAFSDTLEAPGPLVLTAPDLSSLVITKGQPIDLSWTGDSAGTATVKITSRQADGFAVLVTCHWDPAAGGGTIPAEATEHLLVTDTGDFRVVSHQTKQVTAGGWDIELLLTKPASFGGENAMLSDELVIQ